MTKVPSALRHRELCKTDFDLDAVAAASDSHSFMPTRRMAAKSGGARRGLLVLVRNRTAAEQTDLCVKVRTMFLLTAGSENVFKSSSRVVRKGGDREIWHQLSWRTEP